MTKCPLKRYYSMSYICGALVVKSSCVLERQQVPPCILQEKDSQI